MRELIHEKDGKFFKSKVYREGDYAIKTVIPKTEEAEDCLFKEHDILLTLHERTSRPELFIKPVDYMIKDGCYVLVTEWIENSEITDLKSFIAALYDISTELKRVGIRHRDIWECNILVRDNLPVLIDFGWACNVDENDGMDEQLERSNDDESMMTLIRRLSGTQKPRDIPEQRAGRV
jgi:RIO-like serine/threonine protein kinase